MEDYRKIAIELGQTLISKAPETREDVERMLPELKESEDERMIQYFKDLAPFDKADELYEKYGFSHKDAIAWLEKQGEQILANSAKTCKDEQKPADKVEPKFRKGDWVVYCNDDVDLITGIEENGYSINNGGYIPFICENEMRLWNITDAKVGDVLVSESNCGLGTWYCIFKSLDGDESMTVYCYLARDGRFETKKELCFDKDPYNTKPATKEQRDQLEKAMNDAGYTFDFEKKELKKIEQKPAWSEEDEAHIMAIDLAVNRCLGKWHCCGEKCPISEHNPWLKCLKERVLPQNTWKPSDEQIDALRYVTNFDYGGHKATLVSLYEQLKKLRE